MANSMLYRSMSKGFFAASESQVWDLGVPGGGIFLDGDIFLDALLY